MDRGDLRARELRSLTPESFDLDGEPPARTLGRHAHARLHDVQGALDLVHRRTCRIPVRIRPA